MATGGLTWEDLKYTPWTELWMFLLETVQNMWRMGDIPQGLGWTILVLIIKGTLDTRVIVILETLWKVVETLIDTRLRASLQFHDVIHGFRAVRGTATAIMELKIAQELAILDHDPLFLVFLDLLKAYDTVDRDRLLQTLEVYGVGPRMCGILENFWAHHQVVPRQNGYHGPAFPATWGMTQGGLVSLTLFNLVVDNVVQTWLAMRVDDQRVDQNGLEEAVGRCLGVFYVNDGIILSM